MRLKRHTRARLRIAVGAVLVLGGVNDNATFTEVVGFCINEDEGCD